ncbi:MAG: hypothetical protein KKC18_14365 [Chloroflexi bacterium]|nr:hypothetical protein [Chloroflexota bacterium]
MLNAAEKMEQQLATIERPRAVTKGPVGVFSSMENFESSQRMALALCSSPMVPKQYQGKQNIGSMLIALDLAQRIDANPLMVCQNLYVVHGNPAWSAKFLIATFNQSGRYTGIRYEWKGSTGADDYGCRAVSQEKATGADIIGPWIDWKLVKAEGWDKKTGSKWLTMPDKMFQYRAAAWMIDTNAPELGMGIPTADQVEDYIDVDPSTGEVLSRNAATNITAAIKEAAVDADPPAQPSETPPQSKDPAAPALTFAKLADRISKAANRDQIDDAAALIGELPNPLHREELLAMYETRKQGMAQ